MTQTLPKGWKEKSLGDVCLSVLDGDWIESKDQSSTGIRLIQTGNVGLGQFLNKEKKSRFISEKTFNRLRCTEIFPGDCLVSRLPDPIGRSCLLPALPARMITAVDCSILRFDKKQILPQYFIYHTLRSEYYRTVLKESTGATRKRISRKKLMTLPIPVPPLSEQKRIVEKLDKIFGNIDKAKEQTAQNLKNAQEVFESSLDAVLTKEATKWPEKKLNDVCIVERGSSPRPIKSFITTAPDGVNWIKIGDCSGKYVTSTSQKITPEGAKKSRYVMRGDFIISNSMSYGKPYIMDIDGYIHDGWFVLRLNHSILVADFLYYILSSPFAKRQYDMLAAGAIVQNISSDLIKKVKFNLPPIAEQKRLVAQLDNLHNKTQELEKIYTKKLADLDELKQSVLQQAFSGKL